MSATFTPEQQQLIWVLFTHRQTELLDHDALRIYHTLFPHAYHTDEQILAADMRSLRHDSEADRRAANTAFWDMQAVAPVYLGGDMRPPFPDVMEEREEDTVGETQTPAIGNKAGESEDDHIEDEIEQIEEDGDEDVEDEGEIEQEDENDEEDEENDDDHSDSSSNDSGEAPKDGKVYWPRSARRTMHVVRDIRHPRPLQINWRDHYTLVFQRRFPKQLANFTLAEIVTKLLPLLTEMKHTGGERYGKYREVIPQPSDSAQVAAKKARSIRRMDDSLRALESQLGLTVGGPGAIARAPMPPASTSNASARSRGTMRSAGDARFNQQGGSSTSRSRNTGGGANIWLDENGHVIHMQRIGGDGGSQQRGDRNERDTQSPIVPFDNFVNDWMANELGPILAQDLIERMLPADVDIPISVIQEAIADSLRPDGNVDMRDTLQAIRAEWGRRNGVFNWRFELADALTNHQSPLSNLRLAAEAYGQPLQMLHYCQIDWDTDPGEPSLNATPTGANAQPVHFIPHYDPIYKHKAGVQRIKVLAQDGDGSVPHLLAQLYIWIDVMICDAAKCRVCGQADVDPPPRPSPLIHVNHVSIGRLSQPAEMQYAAVQAVEGGLSLVTFWDGSARQVRCCRKSECQWFP